MSTNYIDDMEFPQTRTGVKIHFSQNEIEFIFNNIQIEPDFTDIPHAIVLTFNNQALVPRAFYDLIMIACNEIYEKEYVSESVPIETTIRVLRSLLVITQDSSVEQPSTIQKSIRSKIVGAIFVKSPNAESLKKHQQRGEELLSEINIDFGSEKNNTN